MIFKSADQKRERRDRFQAGNGGGYCTHALEPSRHIRGSRFLQASRVELDPGGRMTACAIDGSSGNPQVDDAVKQALAGFKVSEAPPEDMPKTVKLKVTFKS